MNSVIENFEQWAHLRHPGQHTEPQEHPQEDSMTKLSAAREAISAIADNPLIDAIAEAGIGKWMHADEISSLVGLWREVEYGRKHDAQAPGVVGPILSFSTATPPPVMVGTSAQQLQPQQPQNT